MDPGAGVVQDHIVSVFRDVVKHYDVDGVHMDDYFYPYPISGTSFPDSNTYSAYKSTGGKLGLSDWRRSNIDNLIQRLKNEVHGIKSYMKFGISPFGIWKPKNPPDVRGLSSFDELYADSRKWIRTGMLDYLAPQLYWKIDAPHQSYPQLLKWWLQQNDQKRHIYVGNYASAIGEKGWDVKEIEKQIEISRSLRNYSSLGNIQFSMVQFTKNRDGISDIFQRELYSRPALTPEMTWLTSPSPSIPTNVKVTGNTVSWSRGSFVMYWAIYRSEADVWNLMHVLHKDTISQDNLNPGTYCIRSVNRIGRESSEVNFHIDDTPSAIIG